MNILLIRPKPDKETIGLQNVMICEPLELEYVSAQLKQDGHNIRIVDMILERQPLARIIKEFKPDLVGMTAYITHIRTVKAYARIIKEVLPHCKTVIGGVHAEVVPEDFVDPMVDYILQGNSLTAIRSLALGLMAEQVDFPDIDGVWSPDCPPCMKESSFSYPLPDREGVSKYRHRYYYMFHNPCALMKTSFGCPYTCNFCFCRQITGNQYYTRPVEAVIEELLTIQEQEVYIVDDNFLVDRERVLSFCQALRQRGINKRFLIYGRADFIARNPDVIREFAGCGLRAVIVGLESFSQEELDTYRKHSTLEDNEAAVVILKENGVACYATLILGLEWDEKRFFELKMWLKRLKLVFVNLQPFTPLPGTPLYDAYRERLIIPREEVEKWDLAHLTVKPEKMTVRRYYWNIIKLYYSVTMNSRNIYALIRQFGLWPNLKLSFGASRITMQYLRKVWKG